VAKRFADKLAQSPVFFSGQPLRSLSCAGGKETDRVLLVLILVPPSRPRPSAFSSLAEVKPAIAAFTVECVLPIH
jgi:hypothetical protein